MKNNFKMKDELRCLNNKRKNHINVTCIVEIPKDVIDVLSVIAIMLNILTTNGFALIVASNGINMGKIRNKGGQMKVETYNLYLNGHYVKKATRVVLSSGEKIPFLEKVSNKEAIRNAKYQLELKRKKTPQVTPQVKNKCSKCYGTGYLYERGKDYASRRTCIKCRGAGVIERR